MPRPRQGRRKLIDRLARPTRAFREAGYNLGNAHGLAGIQNVPGQFSNLVSRKGRRGAKVELPSFQQSLKTSKSENPVPAAGAGFSLFDVLRAWIEGSIFAPSRPLRETTTSPSEPACPSNVYTESPPTGKIPIRPRRSPLSQTPNRRPLPRLRHVVPPPARRGSRGNG